MSHTLWLQVLDSLQREQSGLQGSELITTNILLPSLVRPLSDSNQAGDAQKHM